MKDEKTLFRDNIIDNTSHIVKWMKDTLNDSGQKGFVIGLSGGIDSALVATLSSMTQKPTLLVNIPIGPRTEGCKRADVLGVNLSKCYDNVTYIADNPMF